jgi:hypothetical protein
MQYLAQEANKDINLAIQGMAWALALGQMCKETIPDGSQYSGKLTTCDTATHTEGPGFPQTLLILAPQIQTIFEPLHPRWLGIF